MKKINVTSEDDLKVSQQQTTFCARAASLTFRNPILNVKNPVHVKDTEQSNTDMQPTVLLLTQNIGAIRSSDKYSFIDKSVADNEGSYRAGREDAKVSSRAKEAESLGSISVSSLHSAKAEAIANKEDEILNASAQHAEGSGTLTEQTKKMVYEFIADLRGWIHSVACFAEARRQRSKSTLCLSPEEGGFSPEWTSHPENSEIAGVENLDRRESKDNDWWTLATDRLDASGMNPPQIDVIIIHLQEIGASEHDGVFTRFFADALEERLLPEAGWTSGLLMHHADCETAGAPDASKRTLFSGVGSIVFLSPRMCPISSLLLIPHRIYIPVLDDPCSYGGSILRAFHASCFAFSPESRKGFVFISLRVGTVVLNVCNVHLFHDADNTKALKKSPSRYVKRRLDACLEAIAECLPICGTEEPFFIFGDFNTRLDGFHLAQHLQKSPHRIELRCGTRSLRCPDSFWTLFSDSEIQSQLRVYDCEPQHLLEAIAGNTGMELAEMPLCFAPTYLRLASSLQDRVAVEADTLGPKALFDKKDDPIDKRDEGSEKKEGHCAIPPIACLVAPRTRANFARERIPAWCDRILFNATALRFISGCGTGQESANNTTSDYSGNGRNLSEESKDEYNPRDYGASRPRNSDNFYLYDAVSLLHTDHDGVFLFF